MRDILKGYRIFDIDPKRSRSNDFYKNMLEYREHVMKKFSTAIKKPAEFVCLLCGDTKAELFLTLGAYELYECKKCSLVSPNVDMKVAGGHEMYDDRANIKDTIREIVDTYEYRKEKFAKERLKYILEKTTLPQSQINLLDVGCGPGYFLSYLKDEHIQYKGLEFADYLVEIGKGKGLNIAQNDLKDEKKNEYTVATLFDVLEHLTEPVDFFTALNKTLKLGGYVLAYTPHIHSFAYRLMGAGQNTLYPFQHVAFYDSHSLNYLAKQGGFEVTSIEYYGWDIMDYFCKKQYEDEYDYLGKLGDFIPLVQAVLDKQNISNHLRVVLRKTKSV